MSVLITCEVGGDAVPTQLVSPKLRSSINMEAPEGKRKLHAGRLPPRLGYDEAARHVVNRMCSNIQATLVSNKYSMDLVDVSRSMRHQQLFPLKTRKWSKTDKQTLLDTIYHPYRTEVRDTIQQMLRRSDQVVHLSLRTFPLRSIGKKRSPGKKRSAGKVRRADMGLLYDPACVDELELCVDWIDEMWDEVPMLRVRRNYPRRGTVDSITKAMRTEFTGQNYLGIELLLNQAWAGRKVAVRDEVIDGICWTLQTILGNDIAKAA